MPIDDLEEPSSAELLPKSKETKNRPRIFAVLVFLLLAFMALFGYFFTDWFIKSKHVTGCGTIQKEEQQREIECPFSPEDVAELQREIDRLGGLNDQFVEQLAEYEDITNRLNASIEELKHQNEILSDSNDVYEELNGKLKASIEDLQEQNEFLADQVALYSNLNQDLNATSERLKDQVDRLEGEVYDLAAENDRLDDLVGALSNETEHLSEMGDLLRINVDRLESKVNELEVENNRLEALTSDLQSIASFLNETADNLGDAYDEVAAFLAEQISTNRVLVMETLENTYHQRVANWDCALTDNFALEEFSKDRNTPIPANSFSAVMEYVEERVLSDLCLDIDDFEQYMEQRYDGQDITTNRLVASVQRYTWNALDYYFPEGDDIGLSPQDWAAASFNCDNLSVNQQFMMP